MYRLLPWEGADAWLWGAALFALPLAALATLIVTSEGRATRADPELDVAPLPPEDDETDEQRASPATPPSSA